MKISLSAFTPENLVSRDGFGSPVPRQPAHLHTQAESGAYLSENDRRVTHVRVQVYEANTDYSISIPGTSSVS